jgi:hypothetical protein
MIQHTLHCLGQAFGFFCKYEWQHCLICVCLTSLQITVNDSNKLETVIEGLACIAELICRHAVTEALYLQGTSKAFEELKTAVVKLYTCVLRYLSRAKQYFEQGTASKRTLSLEYE